MSYVVANMKKMKTGNLSGIQIHNDRKTTNHSNKDIDVTRSHLNYELIPRDKSLSYKSLVVDYINENKSSTRAIRKDAVLVNEWIISSDSQFFEQMSSENEREFFQTAVDWFSERFGKDNVRYATVHVDEKTPHMHLGIVPLRDGKLTAKTIFNRQELKAIQEELPKYLKIAGFDIQRGQENSERKHLTVPEYKKMKETLELDQAFLKETEEETLQLLADIRQYNHQIDNKMEKIAEQGQAFIELSKKIELLETKEKNLIDRVSEAPNTPYDWEQTFRSKFKKSLIGDSMTIRTSDYKELMHYSSQHVVGGYMVESLKNENQQLLAKLHTIEAIKDKEIVELKNENKTLKSELSRVKKDFVTFVQEASLFLLRQLKIKVPQLNLLKEYAQTALYYKWPMLDSKDDWSKRTATQLKEMEKASDKETSQEKTRTKSRDWDMER